METKSRSIITFLNDLGYSILYLYELDMDIWNPNIHHVIKNRMIDHYKYSEQEFDHYIKLSKYDFSFN
jgi:hypothetical protein